jgi:hypothetical protein
MGAVTVESDEKEERDENDASAHSKASAEDPGSKSNGNVLPWLDARFPCFLRSDGTNLVRPGPSTWSLGY